MNVTEPSGFAARVRYQKWHLFGTGARRRPTPTTREDGSASIDQAPQSPAVASDAMPSTLHLRHMIAAAVQAPQKKIDALLGEVHALHHEQAR